MSPEDSLTRVMVIWPVASHHPAVSVCSKQDSMEQRMARNDATKDQRSAILYLSGFFVKQMRALQGSNGYEVYDAALGEGPGHPIAERTFEVLMQHGWVEEAEQIQGAKRWRISEAGLVAARLDPVRRWL